MRFNVLRIRSESSRDKVILIQYINDKFQHYIEKSNIFEWIGFVHGWCSGETWAGGETSILAARTGFPYSVYQARNPILNSLLLNQSYNLHLLPPAALYVHLYTVQPPQSTAPLALCSTTKRPYKHAPLAPAPVAPCTQPLNNMQLYTAPYGLQYARW